MIIYVDIDETICKTNKDRIYSKSKPFYDRIEIINKLYDEGHEIVYWTARGTGTGIDWRQVTEQQFKEWNVKYNRLEFRKPIYDVFICDKAVNSESFFDEQFKGEQYVKM